MKTKQDNTKLESNYFQVKLKLIKILNIFS